MSILLWFFSPLGRYAALALLLSGFIGGVYLKGRHDDHKSFQEKIVRESKKAITKADTARSTATRRFDAGGMRNDGFARD
jgi:hypothetical protein